MKNFVVHVFYIVFCASVFVGVVCTTHAAQLTNMDADTITTIVNNKSKSVKPASEFPDIARFHERSVYDDKGNKIGKEKVPVRFIKFTLVNKYGKLVDDEDEAVVTFVEHSDEHGHTLFKTRGRRPAKK